MNENALIIFKKNPVAGKVKTRLARTIGDEEALSVYMEFLQHTRNVTTGLDCEKFIFYSEHIIHDDMFENNRYRKYVQCSGDLGEKMNFAFSIPFKSGFKKVVIIGTDLPQLKSSHIEQAFEELDNSDYVIGPAVDGGYYLLGMKKPQKKIFENKAWSTDSVLRDTQSQIEDMGASLSLLETLNDVDTAEDYYAWFEKLKGDMKNTKQID